MDSGGMISIVAVVDLLREMQSINISMQCTAKRIKVKFRIEEQPKFKTFRYKNGFIRIMQ